MKKTTLKFKALLLLGLALIFSIPVNAKVVNVTGVTAGSLAPTIMAHDSVLGQWSNVTELTVTGTIDARDFRTIRDNLGSSLTSLNLSACTIAAFSGDGGTSLGFMGPQSANYGADTVPSNAFYAFWNDWSQNPAAQIKSLPLLSKLVLPNGTKMIDNAALADLPAIKEIDLSNLTSLMGIGNLVFQRDTSLEKIIFPTTTDFKYIGNSVFHTCRNIDTINIPSSVESIFIQSGNFVEGCSKLAALNFEEPAKIKILPPVFFAAGTNFELKALKYFKVPSSVDSLHTTAMGATFNGFMGTYIDCHINNEKYESKNGMLYLKSGELVAIPKGLTEVTLGSDITVLPESAFEGMTGITSITIEGDLTEIGNKAFYNCPITSFSFPSTLVKIGDWAFNGTKLSTVDFSNNTNLTTLGMSIFSGVKTLKGELDLSGLNVMGDGMFYGCDSITGFTLNSNLTKLPFQAFAACTGLESVTLPNSIDTIGQAAFQQCTNLASINMPNSLKLLCFQALDMTSVTSIDLPENAQLEANPSGYGLKYIVVNAHDDSPYYKSEGNALLSKDGTKLIYAANSKVPMHLIIPEGVDTVRDNAFMSLYDSPKVYKVTVPSTLKFVGMNGLTAFNNVDTIVSNAVVPPAAFIDQYGNDNVFGNQYGHNVKQIIIPAQTKVYYVAAPGWKYFSAALFTPDMVYATAQNLQAQVAAQYSNDVNLSWESPVSEELDVIYYNIYRNNEFLDSVSETLAYIDTAAPVGDVYYQVSVQYYPGQFGESERTDSVKVTVELEPVSNALIKNAENISVYPNPTSDFITVSTDCETVNIYNMQGKLLVRVNGNKADMRSLPNGTYVVEAITKTGKSTVKVIKK